MKKKISTYAKENDLTYHTVYNMVKRGDLPSVVLPSGTILIEDTSSRLLESSNRVVLYSRVSSSENKANLDSQMERLRSFSIAKGYTVVKEIKEVGSGLNDNRKKLCDLLNRLDYDIILVEHKDRFSRFGFHFIEILLEKLNKKIEVINHSENNAKNDLMEDFVSIITSFTARLYGLRRSKRRTETLIKELENKNE